MELAGDFPRLGKLHSTLRRADGTIAADGCPTICQKHRSRVPSDVANVVRGVGCPNSKSETRNPK